MTQARPSEAKPFVISKWFKASPERLYRAFTSAKDLGRWMGAEGSELGIAKLEAHEGGIFHYSMTMPHGMVMWGQWKFIEMVPGKRLVVEQNFSDADGGVTVHPIAPNWPLTTRSTSTFESKDQGALLSLAWLPWQASAEQQAAFDGAHDGMRMGWSGTFAQLEAFLAEEP